MKEKGILGFILAALVVIAVIVIARSNLPPIMSKSLVFEYGEPIEVDLGSFVDTEDKEISDSINLDLTSLRYIDDHSYPEVGTYPVLVKYQKLWMTKTGEITINVRDTVSPIIINENDKYTFEEGSEPYDFSGDFVISDYSGVSVNIATQNIDYDKPGEYEGSVIAEDLYGNSSTYTFEVTIEAKPKPKPKVETPSTTADSCLTPSSVAKPTYIEGLIIANKANPLPKDYAPGENKEAGNQVRAMINAMKELGMDISSEYSGYRSYSYQSQLYNSYVRSDGKANAERYSARPGYSEHQTGLAFDLKHRSTVLVEREPEVTWIRENAHKYGFIVRYPQGKESVTGYIYEPWHIRYVGDSATKIYESGLTLEEYYGFAGGGYCN